MKTDHPSSAKNILCIICLLSQLFLTCPLDAANWYVDNAVGSSGNGTTWGSAWKNFSNVVWGAGGVQAGDTLNISGGSTSKTYTETWTVGASGTSGSRITIRTGQDAGHNGTVIFNWQSHVTTDGNGAERTAVAAAINAAGRSYVTFSGNVGGQIRMQMKNLYDVIDRQDGKAISAGSTAGFIVEYVEFRNMNNGVVISSSTAATVRFCSFFEIRGDRAINFTGGTSTFDTTLFHDNYINCLKNNASPPGGGSGYSGPDGIQCPGKGVSVFRNTFVATAAASGVYTSTQHPDMIQGNSGTYLKIYNNDFIDFGDSGINFEWSTQQNPHNIRIFNNVFRVTNPALTGFPSCIRMYDSTSETPMQTVNNVKILNNTFIDNGTHCAIWADNIIGSTPTGSGNEIKNNIFYNVGAATGSTSQTIRIGPSAAGLNWAFDGNVYYTDPALSTIAARIKYNTTTYTASNWIAANEPNGSTSAPTFLRYDGYQDPDNDVQLAASPPGGTVDLSAYFTTDKNGVTRSAWSPGAYEFVGSDLVAHWTLNEASGTSAADSSGNGNTGTLQNGPAWTSGQVDGGLSFDGVDDVVNAGSGSTLDNMPSVTVAAWIKPSSMGEGNFGRIVQKGATATAGFRFVTTGTNELSFAVQHATTEMNRRTTTNAIATGAWRHVAVTWNGSSTATNVRFFVDGVETGYGTTNNGSGARSNDAAANLYIGNEIGLTRTFNGVLDDVRVYKSVLTPSEILALYQSFPPAAPSSLTATKLGYNQINLAWVDNASNETGFKIERKKGAGGTYAQIGTAAANATSYSDTTAGAGTTYYHRVRATNTVGDSGYSNESSATTDEITSGRQGHWKLDETSGTSAADSSGNGNTGTLQNGPTWTTGQLGGGLSFDGGSIADDIVNAGSGSTLDNLSAITVSAWIKPNSVGEGNTARIVKKGTGNNPTGGFRFLTTSQASNGLSFCVDYSTTDLVRISSSNAITMGTWQHVIATWTGSGTATNVKLYVNGVEVSGYATTTNGAGTRGDDSAANLYLGNDSVLSRTFDGLLDDVRVYNRVLSAAEIQAVYAAGL